MYLYNYNHYLTALRSYLFLRSKLLIICLKKQNVSSLKKCSLDPTIIFALIFQSVAEFLKGLPSHDQNNFANFHTDNGNRTCVKRPSVYLPTKDYPSEQSNHSTMTRSSSVSRDSEPWQSNSRLLNADLKKFVSLNWSASH